MLLTIDATIAAQGINLMNPIFIAVDLKNEKLIKAIEKEIFLDTGFYLITPDILKTRDRNKSTQLVVFTAVNERKMIAYANF